MPAMAPTARPSDDFDMAKLQKTLKQRQRQAVRNSAHVAKLTPAEIRSLNNSALASKTGSASSTKSTSSPARSRRSTNATPPATPDEPPAYQAQAHRNSVSRNSSINIPTPPQTPNGHRRSSQSSTHSHRHYHQGLAHGHANGVIHAPRPRVSAQAAFMSVNGLSSRPSSSGSSTYRGLPTYRGPEVTRTGSITMLQYPSQQIVNNPLSYFSRPRQAHVGTSPERSRHEQQEVSIYRAQSLRNTRANSLPNVSAPSSRQPSPPRVTDSPVSMMVDDTEKFPVFNPADDPHNQPKPLSDEEDAQNVPKTAIVDNEPQVAAAPVEADTKEVTAPESPKKEKEKHKRFTIHAALFGGDKGNNESAENKLKKTRRRTLSLPKNDESSKSDGKGTSPTQVPEDVKPDVALNKSDEFSTHPVVRPLSLMIPGEFKGKEKEIVSAPVYARCSCCGKLKRPHGFNSELSPVLENENLRTNFSFEIARTSGSSGRRSSDASRDKFTPIIPMQVGENETRQARIEPYDGPLEFPVEQQQPIDHDGMEIATSSPVRQPLRQSNLSPGRMKRNSAPPRFVRFASLHGRRNGDTGPIAEEDEVDVGADENEPLMIEQDDSNELRLQTSELATMSGVVALRDETMIDHNSFEISSAARAVVEPITTIPTGYAQLDVIDFADVASHQDSKLEAPVAGNPTPRQDEQTASPNPVEETPTSTTTTVTIVTPTSTATATSTATSLSTPSPWERELSASLLGPSSNNAMDLSLRPKYSFESMQSVIDVAEKGKGRGTPEKPTGKRKSIVAGLMGGVTVKG